MSKLIKGARAMVTSPHRLASEAGAQVLEQGGNAAEAAVAMAGVLSVTYPHFCGIGGDAVWMLGDGTGWTTCLLGIGQAPADIASISRIDQRGPGSILTSACAVDSWGEAMDLSVQIWGGSKALGDLLQPAISYARDGFALTASQAFWSDLRRQEASQWPGFAEIFMQDTAQGSLFRQPALAQSLVAIAEKGPREFYEGTLGRRIADGLAAAGVALTADDLKATRTRRITPLRLGYGKDTVLLAPPPPTQGVTTLQIMGMLDRLGLAQYRAGSADHYHCCIEAIKRAFLDRQSLGDPDFSTLPVDQWLSAAHLDRLAAEIDHEKALDWPHPYRTGDTVFFGAADDQGRVASVLQSIYYDWGSGVMAGDTGILWQNRGGAFNLIDGHPNRLMPGKRPFYTLNPGLALRGGKPFLVYGTQGADGQPQTLSLLLSLVLDHGLSPEAALAMPRFLLGRTFSDSRDSLKIEDNVGSDVVASLAERGHIVSTIPVLSPLAGQAGLIRIHGDGTMDGAHDPRSDGIAIGFGD